MIGFTIWGLYLLAAERVVLGATKGSYYWVKGKIVVVADSDVLSFKLSETCWLFMTLCMMPCLSLFSMEG